MLVFCGFGCEGQPEWGLDQEPEPAGTPAGETDNPPILASLGGGTGKPAEATSSAERAVATLHITLDVQRVRVPRGVLSESSKIWNHLDEEAIPGPKSILLQRNGLRVGRGDVDSWPPIEALLEQESDLETFTNKLAVNNGMPLRVEIDKGPRDQTLFLFRPDGTLGGASFPQSMNYLRVEYQLSTRVPGAIDVTVMPEVCMPRRLALPDKNAEPSEYPEPAWRHPVRVLRELAFKMTVGPEQFLAIGPSAMAHQGYLAGSQLLCEDIEGIRYESIYIVTPRLYRAEQTGQP